MGPGQIVRRTWGAPPALGLASACALALSVCARSAGASPDDVARPLTQAESDELRRLSTHVERTVRTLFRVGVGDGVRLNNPYRLSTQLGSDAESASLTAPYVDVGIAAALGRPDGVQHGLALHLSSALVGVPQQVVTPGYLLLHRGASRVMVHGRAGVPVILRPDVNVGGELAFGVSYFLLAGVGVGAELVGDLFYGAGTYDVRYAAYPIVSAQLGVVLDLEVLP